MKLYTKLLITFLISGLAYAQAPNIQWQKSLGGTDIDSASSIVQTQDGGYIVAGNTLSNNGNVTGNHGNGDYWVVKLSSTGTIEWQKCLGGTGDDSASSIVQTQDGGYIVAGKTRSNNGDVTGNHGNDDYWVVKLSSTGTIEWQKCLGGTSDDVARTIIQTTDGGYIISGYTSSNNGDVSGGIVGPDAWIVKLSSTGVIEWQKCIGGTSWDFASSIIQTTEGGYIFAGTTMIVIGSGGVPIFDGWIVKLSSTGVIEWQDYLGGTGSDALGSIIQTTDGGYIVAGDTSSNNGDVSGNHGYNNDYWVVKLSTTGAIEWQKCLGGTGIEFSTSLIQTLDGGYIVAGISESIDGDVTGNHGGKDSWVVKLSSTGSIEWQKSLGGSSYDYGDSIIQNTDGDFIVAGYSYSNDGDVSGNHGGYDYWIVKLTFNLSNDTFDQENKISLFPNPTKDHLTIQLDYFSPNQKITITDLQGKIIKTLQFDGLTQTISTSSLSKGIYFISVVNETQKTTKKFIVE